MSLIWSFAQISQGASLNPWFLAVAHEKHRRQTSRQIDRTCLGITLMVRVVFSIFA
jgi:hypothetical protein